ncbi:MAG: amidohydrolase [Acidobacteriia bacterium]|nr:amidohydrolase [Terriglobia bacterium]
MRWAFRLFVLIAAFILIQDLDAQTQIGYRTDQDADAKKRILLKDYKPESMVHVPARSITRARYPVIDVHSHVNDAMGIDEEQVNPAGLVAMMDRNNIRTIVILTGMWGDKLQKVLDEMVKPYPGRFLVFTQIDWSKIDDPGFSQLMVKQMDDSVARGARGLKVLKDLGLGVRDKTGKLITVDDPRLDPIWEECGRLGIPVFIHTGDPEAFFHPTDAKNERYEELVDHPDWSFHGPDFPSIESLLEARNRVIARHPRTIFVSLHMGWPENLEWVANALAKYPNLYMEFGAREAELGRQPRQAQKLFLAYPDRILFGSDSGSDEKMYRNYFRWLETADEYFDYYGYPEQGRWKIYGIELPNVVLDKIYHRNAEKIFAQFKETKPVNGEIH